MPITSQRAPPYRGGRFFVMRVHSWVWPVCSLVRGRVVVKEGAGDVKIEGERRVVNTALKGIHS